MTTEIPSAAGVAAKVTAEAVRLMHAEDRWMTDLSEAAYGVRYELSGRLLALRWVLCLLKGWNPTLESVKGGKADGFLRVSHNLPGGCSEKDCGAW